MEAAALPRQAQKQLDEAEEIARLIEEEANPPAPVEGEPPEVIAAEPEPEPPAPEPEPDPDEDWKTKYHSLQGKYDAEVPRLHQLNNDLQTQVQNLSNQVEQLSEEIKKAPDPAPAPAPSSITEKDEEAFGSDLIDLNRRVVAEEMAKIAPKFAALETENADLKEQLKALGSQSEKTAAELFNDRLTEAVPAWREIDTQQGWLDWLNEVDPMSGLTRQTYLRNAITQMDVERTANIFRAYVSLSAPPPPVTEDETPAPTPADELQSQVTPSRSAAPTTVVTPADPSARIWTGADVEAALDPRKLSKMSDAEQATLFSEIDAAQAQGRVVP